MTAVAVPDDKLRSARQHLASGLFTAGIVTLFEQAVALAAPFYSMELYNRVGNSRNLDTLVSLTIAVIGAMVFYAILDYLRSRLYMRTGERLARSLTVPTLVAAASRSRDAGAATIASQGLRDLNDIRLFMSSSAVAVPIDLILAPVLLAVLFLLHPAFGTVATVSALLLVGLNFLTDRLTRHPLAEANEAAARTFSDIAVTVRNAEVVEGLGMLPAIARRWQRAQAGMLTGLYRGTRTAKAFTSTVKSCRLLMTGAIVTTGVLLTIDHGVSGGAMLAANMILAKFLLPFEQLVSSWRQFISARQAWHRLERLLASAEDKRDTLPLPCESGRLVVDRLVYIPPGHDHPILRGITFKLDPGEVLGIIGPSAAGKSTLARLIVGMDAPTAGGVYLDGNNTFLWERGDFGQHVGYVPQAVTFVDGTVADNIARMQDADPADIIAAAKRAGIHDLIAALPHGYATPIGDAANTLSGGQRQRVALARALFGNPKLIVLDEPNSNLDQAGEQDLIRAVAATKAAGISVLLVTHRPSIIGVADKLLVINEGMVKHFGMREKVLGDLRQGPIRLVRQTEAKRLAGAST